MNFLEIQNLVLADRFDESKRAAAKVWINSRYGRIWNSEPWTFKFQQNGFVLNPGESNHLRGTIGDITSLFMDTGTSFYTPLTLIRPEDFFQNVSLTAGDPGSYSVIGDAIYFDTKMATTRTFFAVSEKVFVPLVADGDIPLIPEEYQVALIHGASAEGCVWENDPSAELFEKKYQEVLDDMKKAFLSSGLYVDAFPPWP